MRHVSSWLTMLLLGCVPLTAAALDYGPNRPLLAAENGAPQLPALQRDASGNARPDVMTAATSETPDPSPAAPRMAPSASSSPPAAVPRGRGPTASAKPRSVTPIPSDAGPGPATWQSLLPGSIQ